jgi:prepilin-type N-terminal cleavage/methylation domain-containing protein
MNRPGPGNCRGFTLVEAMICLVIAGLAFAGTAQIIGSGGRLSTINRTDFYAANALRQEAEALRNTSFDTVAAMDGATFTNDQIDKLNDGSGGIAVADSFGSDIKKVTLSVSWTAKNGADRSKSLTTYVTRSGINGA